MNELQKGWNPNSENKLSPSTWLIAKPLHAREDLQEAWQKSRQRPKKESTLERALMYEFWGFLRIEFIPQMYTAQGAEAEELLVSGTREKA